MMHYLAIGLVLVMLGSSLVLNYIFIARILNEKRPHFHRFWEEGEDLDPGQEWASPEEYWRNIEKNQSVSAADEKSLG